MSGARLIVNARYFHIARPGEAASKYALVPEAAAGLVNYIATRESVLLNFSAEYEQRPATQKQKDAIERFLESSPDIEKSREYKAYAEHPTGANASRLGKGREHARALSLPRPLIQLPPYDLRGGVWARAHS